MKQIIGFANKFYTLWNYECEPVYKVDAYGTRHHVSDNQKFFYLKNISFDLEKAKEAYPNASIDLELRGTKSFTRDGKIELPEGYFWAGKYSGKLIDEIIESDFQYCLWFVSNYNGQATNWIKNHAKYTEYLGDKEKEKLAVLKSAMVVNVGDVVELEFLTNGYNADEEYKECWTKAKLGETEIGVCCSGVRLVDGMYPYLMPMINGKTQKTKGKKIEVKVIEVFNTEVYGGLVNQQIRVA